MHWDHRIGRRLNLRDLHIFLGVAQAGSMAKAAKRLAISQPAVSRAISDMEHTLGVTLFDRSRQGVEPTKYGHALITRGIAVFDELKHGVQDIEFLSDPSVGELKVGANPTSAEGIVSASIDRLSRQLPRVRFHVMPGDTAALQAALRDRRIEVAFARVNTMSSADEIEAELLFEEPLVVVAGVQSPWARRRTIKLAELIDEPWTWAGPETPFHLLVEEAFRASGIEPPHAAVHASSASLRISLAATGRYLAIVPAAMMKFRAVNPSIKLLPVELPTTKRQIAIMTLKNRTLSPLAHLFIKSGREVAKGIAKGRSAREFGGNGNQK